MGQIADDMISGASCSWCGVYFPQEHGFPVLCPDCYNNATEKERAGLTMALHVDDETDDD